MVKGIYIIKNFKNGKVYIGQTGNLKTRWRSHIHLLRKNKHGNSHLQSAFNKSGEKYFRFIILEKTCDLNNREKFWISTFGGVNSHNNYNQKSGGNVNIMSDLVKSNISKRQKGRKLTAEHSANISKANKGNPNMIKSESVKKYLSKLYSGRPLTEETKRKISETKKGVPLSEATRFKLKGRGSRPIIQYSLTGVFIKEFVSAKEAGEMLNFWKSDITQCCLGNRNTVKNFIFKYKNNESNS